VLLPMRMARVRIELSCLIVDAIDRGDALYSLFGDQAAACLVEANELAPRVRPAGELAGALGKQRLVACEIIDHQVAAPVIQKALRVLAAAAAAVVEHHQRRARAAVGEQIRALGLTSTGIKLLNRCLFGRFAASLAARAAPSLRSVGTLLERALDPHERHKLGAHYTPRAYVERLVLPTVIEPLREEWALAQAAALTLAAENKHDAAVVELKRFHHRLCTLRVLDPACGSGNFLYVTLEHLKRLEGEVLNVLDEFGYRQPGPSLTLTKKHSGPPDTGPPDTGQSARHWTVKIYGPDARHWTQTLDSQDLRTRPDTGQSRFAEKWGPRNPSTQASKGAISRED